MIDSPIRLADRVCDLVQTDLTRLSARCREIGGINLSQGVCDVPAPLTVKQAAIRAVSNDQSTYTNISGMIELRTAIAAKMSSFNKITADPETQIAVTVGTTGAFACVAAALLNPADEVIVFSPGYYYYVDTLKLFGVSVRLVNCEPPYWEYSSEELADAFNDRTRMVIVNTPGNPTGKVFSRDELHEIACLAKRYNAWIVADEVYEYITYERDHISIGSLPQAMDRTVTLSGPSKTYAVTGWRIGYAVGPAEVIRKARVVNDLFYICAPSPMQHGVLEALALPQAYYDGLKQEYQLKRDLLAQTLEEIGFRPYSPQGAIYIMADFGQDRYDSALHAAETILEKVGVATVPGAPFYMGSGGGNSVLRVCFAKRLDELEEACNRLRCL